MAESDVPVTNQPEVQSEQERLKYLEFVQVAMLHAFLYASKVYGYAKENSGSLKPGVETIEGTIKAVAGPAYHKFHDIPVEVLKFVDRKVDESVTKLDSQVPSFVKQLSPKTKNMSTLASEIKNADLVEIASGLAVTAYTKLEPTAKGLYTKYEPTAKELYTKYEPTAKELYTKYEPAAKVLYTKYEPVAEQYAVSAWQSLNQLSYFSKVANVVVPKAAYYSEMYNQTVKQTAAIGFPVSSYLPLVPTDKIAKEKLNIEEKIDIVLSWPSEEPPPVIKGSLDANEDICVVEVSSSIDDVFDIGESNVESMEVRTEFSEFSENKENLKEVVVGSGEACGVGEDELKRVIPALKDGSGEFDGCLYEINLNLSEELANNGVNPIPTSFMAYQSPRVRQLWEIIAKGGRMVLCYVQGSGRRKRKKVLVVVAEGRKTTGVENGIAVGLGYGIPESRELFKSTP
nr:REF/SRPP-like protein At3g05500 [Tanacetum cinerariifolium]